MNLVSILALAIWVVCFVPPACVVLRVAGVEHKLLRRAFQFGVLLAVIQLFIPIVGLLLAQELGAMVASIVALPASYWYVNHVLAIQWWKNILIIVVVPFLGTLLASPALFMYFRAVA